MDTLQVILETVQELDEITKITQGIIEGTLLFLVLLTCIKK